MIFGQAKMYKELYEKLRERNTELDQRISSQNHEIQMLMQAKAGLRTELLAYKEHYQAQSKREIFYADLLRSVGANIEHQIERHTTTTRLCNYDERYYTVEEDIQQDTVRVTCPNSMIITQEHARKFLDQIGGIEDGKQISDL